MIRVVVIGRRPLVRDVVAHLPPSDFMIVGRGRHAPDILRAAAKDSADAIVLTTDRPHIVLERCRFDVFAPPILVICPCFTARHAAENIGLGATGYLPREAEPKELERALTAVANREIYVPASILKEVLITLHEQAQKKTRRPLLSERQIAIVGLLRDGTSEAEIMTRLGIRPSTLANQLARIASRLKVKDHAAIAEAARRYGIGEIDPI
jgi:DNA-binding NarL/FixJ family response regulator